jgi:hypothetical protein
MDDEFPSVEPLLKAAPEIAAIWKVPLDKLCDRLALDAEIYDKAPTAKSTTSRQAAKELEDIDGKAHALEITLRETSRYARQSIACFDDALEMLARLRKETEGPREKFEQRAKKRAGRGGNRRHTDFRAHLFCTNLVFTYIKLTGKTPKPWWSNDHKSGDSFMNGAIIAFREVGSTAQPSAILRYAKLYMEKQQEKA